MAPLPLTAQEQGWGTANNDSCSDKSGDTSPNSRTVLHWRSFVYVDIHMGEGFGLSEGSPIRYLCRRQVTTLKGQFASLELL